MNTGWSGGPYGVGARIPLPQTRAIVDAIHSGELTNAPCEKDPIFGFDVITECPRVPDDILIPKNTWADADDFQKTAANLAKRFQDNFHKYADGVSKEVCAAGPVVPE